MKTIYNIEDFVINEMLMPYQNIIIENPTEENIKEAKRILRKNPQNIIGILKNNKKAYECVFRRLSRIDFKFYKWLSHPLIDEINGIVMAFRNLQGAEEHKNKDIDA